MRVFVFEFVTGGGLAGRALPEFLPDAEAMWQALVSDLSAIAGVKVLTLRDDRLPAPRLDNVEVLNTHARRFEDDYARCLAWADAVWPVAPEEADCLETLNRGVMAAGKRLLGCRPDAVRITASKYATARLLNRAGVKTVPTFASPRSLEKGGAVAKPDTGAGCQETRYFHDRVSAREWASAHIGAGFVFQPYVSGESLSLSVVCARSSSELLSVNRQDIRLENDWLSFHGVAVNALPDREGRYARLAQRVTSVIPGLWGYVGIDLLETKAGPVILEVNPRVTVSYAGLRPRLGFNPAEKVLKLPAMESLRSLPPARSISDAKRSRHSSP